MLFILSEEEDNIIWYHLHAASKKIYTMEYYSATEKSEIMPPAATQIDLEITTPSEASHTEKDKYHVTSLR